MAGNGNPYLVDTRRNDGANPSVYNDETPSNPSNPPSQYKIDSDLVKRLQRIRRDVAGEEVV